MIEIVVFIYFVVRFYVDVVFFDEFFNFFKELNGKVNLDFKVINMKYFVGLVIKWLSFFVII